MCPLAWPEILAWLIWKYANARLGVDLAAYEPQRIVNAGFRCPLLLIQGDDDRYVPLSHAEVLAAATGGPVELWRVSGVPHRGAREVLPNEYRRRVTEFFEKWA